jgi:hypothetical protein
MVPTENKIANIERVRCPPFIIPSGRNLMVMEQITAHLHPQLANAGTRAVVGEDVTDPPLMEKGGSGPKRKNHLKWCGTGGFVLSRIKG